MGGAGQNRMQQNQTNINIFIIKYNKSNEILGGGAVAGQNQAGGVVIYMDFSDVRGAKIPKLSPQMCRTKIVHVSGTCSEILRK